jgi:hypothetical protein
LKGFGASGWSLVEGAWNLGQFAVDTAVMYNPQFLAWRIANGDRFEEETETILGAAQTALKVAEIVLKIQQDRDDYMAARLKRRRLGAHTVQVKVRYGDFMTLTRQLSVEDPLTEASDIYRLGCVLLGREKLVSRPLRLLGLGVSNLREPAAQQLALF